MAEMNKLNVDALENVAGGATRTVANDAVDYANVREKPGLNSKVMFKIPNGEKVYTTGKKVTKDGYTSERMDRRQPDWILIQYIAITKYFQLHRLAQVERDLRQFYLHFQRD